MEALGGECGGCRVGTYRGHAVAAWGPVDGALQERVRPQELLGRPRPAASPPEMPTLFGTRELLMLASRFAGIISFVALLTPAAVAAQRRPLDEDRAERIANVVTEWLALRGAPGVAVGVVCDTAIVFARGFGVRDADRPADPITENTLFHVASNSKPFVAAAVLQLADEGRLELDAPVVRYLPFFRARDPASVQITVRQLLSHTSGLPDEEDYTWGDHRYEDGGALVRYVRSLADESLIDQPGVAFHYSNPGYSVVGAVVAAVTGRPFEDYLKVAVLDPLGMTDSDFLLQRVPAARRARPHVWEVAGVPSDTVPYSREHAPSSTLWSSAREMSHWLMMQLGGGARRDARILTDSSHALAWAPAAETGWGGYDGAYGLGWFVGQYRGRRIVSHKGRDWGFGSMAALLPDDALGVVVLGNASFAPIAQITEAVLDVMLGAEPAPRRTSGRYALGLALAAGGPDSAVTVLRNLDAGSDPRYTLDAGDALQVGRTLLRHGRTAEAVVLLTGASEVFPAAPRVWALLGRGHALTGDRDSALRALEEAHRLAPDDAEIGSMLERVRAWR